MQRKTKDYTTKHPLKGKITLLKENDFVNCHGNYFCTILKRAQKVTKKAVFLKEKQGFKAIH